MAEFRLATWLLVALSFPATVVAGEAGSTRQPIVSGTATDDYPQVVLLSSELANGGVGVCSGTLITPRLILTAAHCLSFQDEVAALAARFDTPGGDVETLEIVDSIAHPRFDFEDPQGGYDIGIAVLASPASVEPLLLSPWPVYQGQQSRIVGWGQTSSETFDSGTKRTATVEIDQVDPALMLYSADNGSACRGDSGGPNLIDVRGTTYVAGVTSFGDVDCQKFSAATRLDVHLDTFVLPMLHWLDPPSCEADDRCSSHCDVPDPDCAVHCIRDDICDAVCSDDPDCGATVATAGIIGGCSTHQGESPWPLVVVLLWLCVELRER